jgi:beta-glucosidase
MKKRTNAIVSAINFVVTVLLANAVLAEVESKPIYMDPSQPVDKRVEDLVGRMTLEEKASQLVNHTRAIPRLGVPEYNLWSEALHGVANNGIATVFPQAIGLAATFDPPLVQEMARATGREGRAKYNMALRDSAGGVLFGGVTFFSPNINIFRDPRWGRGQETYGEDPFLTGKMAVAFITGLQGDDPRHLQAVATAKHYAVHSGPEPLRHGFNAVVSLHDMEDTYLPAFREAVVEGGVRAVMCVYNAVNGVPGCASDFLLGDTLRDQWKFEGFVTGDCDAVHDIHANHKFVKTAAEGAAAAIKAGTDNDCVVVFGPPAGEPEYQKYIDAVRQGLLDEALVDRAVSRMLRTRFALGLFDPPDTVKPAQVPDSIVDSDAHRALALKIARESMVLLKNDGILPLTTSISKIAVVGPLADSTRVLLGNYNGTPSRATTALDGIRKQFPSAQVTFEPGTTYLRPLSPIPASALSTDDGGPGLKAEIFAGREPEGEPVETRIDPQVLYGVMPGTWPRGSGTPPPSRAARWTGWLTPTASGIHTLAVEGFGNRLYLDDKLLVDTTGGFPIPRNAAEVQLEKGRKYALKVEAVPRFFASTRLAWQPAMPDATARAVAAATEADVVVAVVGITAELEGEESALDMPGFKGGDRTSLDLPKEQEDLLKAVKASGKPLVVVLMSGSPLAVTWADAQANAILQAWYPGEEGGQAIAETLSGANNPAGRLPVTFHTGVVQLPEFTDYSMANRTYRYFKGQPLYPFGHGLSYSTFAYDGLELSTKTLPAGDSLRVKANVKNTSDRDGDEVVQVYLAFPKLGGAPVRALRGIQRIHLKAGEARTVEFTLDDRDLSHVSESGKRLVGAGAYDLSVGGGQPGAGSPLATAGFEILGEKELSR